MDSKTNTCSHRNTNGVPRVASGAVMHLGVKEGEG